MMEELAADGETQPPDEEREVSLMGALFAWHLEEILQTIFLGLDAESIKSARLVSSEWNQFIRERIWDCKWTRAILRERLWNNFAPSKRTLVTKGSTTSLACDNGLIICGFTDGSATVYDANNGDKIAELDDRRDAVLYCSTQVGLTATMAVTSCAGTEMADDWQDVGSGRYFSLALWCKDDWSLIRRFEDKELIRFSTNSESILVRLKKESYLWNYDCPKGPAILPPEKEGVRLSVSEENWSAGWNGTAVTVTRPNSPPAAFSLRSVAVLKLLVGQQALLAATTDRKVFVLDLALAGGRCARVLTVKKAVTDMRSNGTVAALLLEDLSIQFFKVIQLTDSRIPDERLWSRNVQLDIPRSQYVGPLTAINTTCMLACAKGSCQIQLYDFWHNPPSQLAPLPAKIPQHIGSNMLGQPGPSPVKFRKQSNASAEATSSSEEDSFCQDCIRKIVKSLALPSGSGAASRAAAEAAEGTAPSPDSVCLLPDRK